MKLNQQMQAKGYFKHFFLTNRWYMCMAICAALLFVSFIFKWLFFPVMIATVFIFGLTIIEYAIIFLGKKKVSGVRQMPSRLSLGDNNPITIAFSNTYLFDVFLNVIEELPIALQERNFRFKCSVKGRKDISYTYNLRPTERGEFSFGHIITYVTSRIGLVQRRFLCGEENIFKVYPSYLFLQQYHTLAATSNMLFGNRKVRRIGHSLEFEKIKEYVVGDDMRSINWKASARKGEMMVNIYTDTQQQQIYSCIDMGRNMMMTFDELTLLDYSINATLALLNVVLMKHDKAGLITFNQKIVDMIPAEKRSGQINILLEALYKQQTNFKESDYESLLIGLHNRITQRSFILLFTNFESMAALERQLPYLRQLAKRHLLCVIFFNNTSLKEIHEQQPDTIEQLYIKTIAEKFDYEKRQIVMELRKYGILSILTTPQQLTTDVINKYLELKVRQLI